MPAMFDLINFTEQGWGGALLKGLWMTLQISAGAFLVGLAIGLAVACLKLGGPKPLRPNAFAASIWPKGIAWIAARKISDA